MGITKSADCRCSCSTASRLGGDIALNLPVDVFSDLNKPAITILTEAERTQRQILQQSSQK